MSADKLVPTNEDSMDNSNTEIKKKERFVLRYVNEYEHPLFDGDEYSRRDAWGWIYANAAWSERRQRVVHSMTTLQRGQLVGGRRFLAEKWGWSEKRVRTFLNQLIRENMIKMGQCPDTNINIITVCNYSKYQDMRPSRGQTEGQTEGQERAKGGPDMGHNSNQDFNQIQKAKLSSAREKIDEKLVSEFCEIVGLFADRVLIEGRLETHCANYGAARVERGLRDLIEKRAAGELRGKPLNVLEHFIANANSGAEGDASKTDRPKVGSHNQNRPAWAIEKDARRERFMAAMRKYATPNPAPEVVQ